MPSCTFTVPGCCEHWYEDHLRDDMDHVECYLCGSHHEYRAPVLCGHEESEHIVTYDPDTGDEPIWCRPCGHEHPFAAEVAA